MIFDNPLAALETLKKMNRRYEELSAVLFTNQREESTGLALLTELRVLRHHLAQYEILAQLLPKDE